MANIDFIKKARNSRLLAIASLKNAAPAYKRRGNPLNIRDLRLANQAHSFDQMFQDYRSHDRIA